MLTKTSRDITSNSYSPHQIIQFSTLGRAYRKELVNRYSATPRSVQIASIVSRVQLAAGRSFAGLLVVLLTLFYPVGAYAQDAVTPSTSEAPTSVSNTAPSAQPSTTTPASQQTTTPTLTVVPSPTPPATTDTASSANQPKSAKKTGPKKAPPKPANPKTGPQKPNGADANKYVYNEKTGRWENGQYAWDPATGQSKPINALDYSYNPETKAWDTTEWRYDPSEGKYVPNNVTSSPQPIGNEIPLNGNSTQFFSLYNNAAISNSVNSHAQSGDSWVTGNTLAGNALSGDALALVNIFNMINSSAGFQNGGEIATFSSDIYGNVYGDLYVDPAALTALQPASGVGGTDGNTNINVNADLSNSVSNDVNLNAQSGNANVSHNTTGGNATSGSANAVANLINMLNSAISSGGSFLGVLNIYGSLNGDILLPPGLLNALLASNATNKQSSNNASVSANLNDTQSITNNIKTSATTGNANVAQNTKAGNATTGNGQTNVTILNLTGRNVVAANSLLVFVNVLGQWVGVIMDAPTGTTSAALGSGVTANSSNNLDANYSVNTSNAIVNNVDVNAKSGDANVTGNTKAGNATTGDATASVNVANISNSNFSLSGWFGILFINVFGSWNGSFGVDTVAGNKPKTQHPASNSSSASALMAPKVFQFVPTSSGGGTTLAAVDMNNPASAEAVSKAVKAAQQKIGATTSERGSFGAQPQPTSSSAQRINSPDYTLPILSFAFGGVLLGGEQIVSRRQRHKQIAA